jgi:hypothetical protein
LFLLTGKLTGEKGENMDEATRKALSKIGRMGGKASAKALTKKQRIERARKGGKARQAKAKKGRG